MTCELCLQEMQQCRQQNLRAEDEILKRHALERRRFPQLLKHEQKTRLTMFKESLRISPTSSTPDQDREKIKQVHAYRFTLESGLCKLSSISRFLASVL